MMELSQLRREIDAVDAQLLPLFLRRMEISRQVAEAKQAAGLPTRNAAREEEILDRVASQVPEEMAPYARALYKKLFELSRDLQNELRK